MQMGSKSIAWILLAAAMAGCQAEYRSDAKKLDSLWTEGAYEQAATRAWKDAREEARHKKNRVVYFLEAGRAAQAAGDYATSAHAYDHAFVDTFPYLAESPEATVSEGIVTTVGNDTMAIYRGTPNDRIMLHTLNALNFMAMGDMATARVELNRALVWQEDAEHRYARAIELAHKANAESVDAAAGDWHSDGGDGWSSDSAGVMHGNTAQIMAEHYGDLPAQPRWSDYCSPFTWHLDGVFRLAVGSGHLRGYGTDLATSSERLKETTRRVPQLVPLVHEDITHALSGGGSLQPTTWIYFMTGQTPELEEKRITMPLALAGGFTMPTLALPKMVPNDDMVPWLEVRTDESGSTRTHLLADTAEIAQWQFKERLPIIISQEAVRATGKAVAAWFATRYASQQQNLAASLLALGTVIYQVGSAQADLRCWHTLPAQVQLARIPTPPSGRISLSTPSGVDLGHHEVAPSESNVLVVSMPSTQSIVPSVMPIQLTGTPEPWVASFDLRADPEAPDGLDPAPHHEASESPAHAAAVPAPAHEETHGSVHESAPAGALAQDSEPIEVQPDEPPVVTSEPADATASADAPPTEPIDEDPGPPLAPPAPPAALDDPDAIVDVDEVEQTPDTSQAPTAPISATDHEADSVPPVQQPPPNPEPDRTEPAVDPPAKEDAPPPAPDPAADSTPATTADTPPAADPIMPPRSGQVMRIGPHHVKAIKASWTAPVEGGTDLQAMLDTPVRLGADASGYFAHDGASPLLVTTPAVLVRRQSAPLHADAMHAMAQALGKAMARQGFVGLTVTPACTRPDQRGQVELHLLVHMPVGDAHHPPPLPDHLMAVPWPHRAQVDTSQSESLSEKDQ